MNLKEIGKLLHNENKFIFLGEELHLTKKFIDQLKSTLNPDFLIFNYIELDQRTETCEEVLMKIESVPMMDTQKIVHLTNFNFAIEGNTWTKGQIKEFEERLKILPRDIKLVISNDSIHKAGHLGLYKSLSKIARVIKLDRLDSKDLRFFLEEEFKSRLEDRKISMELLNEIIKLSGYTEKDSKTNLYDIEGMITKVTAIYKDTGAISKEDLYIHFQQKKEPNIFRFLNAIRDVNKPEAFKEYSLLRESGEANIKIMITLAKMLSTMVVSSYYFAEGYNAKAIAQELNKSPYAIESGLVFVRKFGRTKLIDMVDQIVEIDYKMKTGEMDESLYGELALMRIFDIIEN